jgi:hypothetical protein
MICFPDFAESSTDSSQESTPQLGGTTVWVSGREGDGFHVALSPDAKAKVQGTLDACDETDNSCYQDVRDVIHSADLHIDNQLERRDFAQLLSKTFKKIGFVFAEIAAVLMSQYKLRHEDLQELGLYLPEQAASQIAAVASATTIVISAQGSGVGTITPTPDPTQLQG